MSSDIEKRIVEIEFQNRNFEKSIKQSQKSIQELNESLKFKDADKNIAKVQKALKETELYSLSANVKKISDRFSELGIVGTTALMRITNAAITAGKNLVNAFTVAPIASGLSEYETQMNSVQTILANTKSKGTNLEQVNAALDELNRYADKTIYNFTEMTRNIGTFTAAGVDLNTSVNAIQGIANLAAVSGSNAQQASTAMYQLSQALAAGRVSLMDWNSVVNAGMGGEVFQQALRKVSEAMGTGAEAAIAAKGSFRESLQTGWLTADVLTETLKKFTTSGANEWVAEYTGLTADAVKETLTAAEAQYGEAEAIEEASKQLAEKSGKNQQEIKDVLEMARTAEDAATKVKTFSQLMDTLKEAVQSGWSETWRTVIGDFEEAKELFTDISNVLGEVIQKSSEMRNNMLKVWKALGGRTKLLEGLANISRSILDIWNSISQAFYDVFGIVGKELYEMTEQFTEFTKQLVISNQTAEDFKRVIRGLASILNIFTQIISAIVKAVGELFVGFKPIVSTVLHFFAIIGDGITIIMYILKQTGILDTVGKAVARTLLLIVQVAMNLLKIAYAIGSVIVNAVINWYNTIKEKFGGIGGYITHLLDDLKNRFPALGNAIDAISSVFSNFGQKMADLFASLKETLSGGGSIVDKLHGIVDAIKNAFGGVADFLVNVAKTIGSAVGSIIDWFSERNWVGAFITITTLSLLLVGIFKIFNTITTIFGGVAGAISSGVTQISKSISSFIKAKAMKERSEAVLNIAKSIALLAASLIALSFVDTDNLKNSAIAIGIFTVAILALTAGINILAGVISTKLKLADNGMSGIGKSMLSMALSMILVIKAVSNMQAEINKVQHYGDTGFIPTLFGLIGAFTLLAALVTVINIVNAKWAPDAGKHMISNVFMLLAVVSALKKLSDPKLDLGKGAIGLVAVAGFLAVFAFIQVMASKFSSGTESWKNMLASAIALELVLNTMLKINRYPANTILQMLGKSLGVIFAFRLVISAARKAGGKDASKTILAMGAAFFGLVLAMKIMGRMDYGAIKRGTKGVFMMMMPMGVLMIISKWNRKIEGSVKTLVAMSGAIAMMSLCASLLSLLDTDAMWRGTIAVSIMTAVMGGILALTKFINKEKEGIKTLVTMTVVIGVLSLCAGLLAMLDMAKVIASFSGIVAVFGMMTLVFLSLKHFNARASRGLLAMVAPIGVLAAAMIVMAQMDVESSIETAIGFSVFLVALAASMKILGSMDPTAILNGVFGLMAVGLGLLLLFDIFGLVIMIMGDGSYIIKGAKLIGDAIGAFIGGLIGSIGEGMASTMPAIGSYLSEFMTNIQGFVAGSNDKRLNTMNLGALFSLAGLVTTLGLASLGAPGVSWIGDALGNFGTGLVKFTEATENIDTSTFDMVSQMFSGVGNLVTGLSGFSSDKMTEFTDTFPALAEKIAEFSNALLGESSLSVENATKAAQIFTAFAIAAASVPRSGGFIGLVAGDADLGAFVKAMGDAGPAIRTFHDQVTGLDAANVQGALTILGEVVKVAGDIPNSGGWIGEVVGENDLDAFTAMMAKAAPDIVHFYNWVKGIQYSQAAGALNILDKAVKTAANIPNSGGWLGEVVGNNNLDAFCEMMANSGEDIKTFVTDVTGITYAKAEGALDILAKTVDVAAKIPKTGSAISWLTGDNSLSKFTHEMALAGFDLQVFLDTLSFLSNKDANGKDIDTFKNAGKAIEVLGDVIEVATGVDMQNGWEKFWEGDDSLTAFGKDLGTFAPYFKTFWQEMKDVDLSSDDVVTKTDTMVKFLDAAAKFAGVDDATLPDLSETTGKQTIYSLISGMEQAMNENEVSTNLNTVGSNILNKFRNELYPDGAKWSGYFFIRNFGDNLKTEVENDKDFYKTAVGEPIVNNVASAFEGKTMDDAAVKFSDGLVNAVKKHLGIESPSKKFQEIGVYIVSGLSLGLQNGKSEIQTASSQMASTLENQFREDLGIHSPSTTFTKLGENIVAGLENGIGSDGGITDVLNKSLGLDDLDWGKLFGDYGADISTIFKDGINLDAIDFGGFSFKSLDDGSFVDGLLAKIQEGIDDGGLTADITAVFDPDQMQSQIDSMTGTLSTSGTGSVATATMDSFENTKFEDSQQSDSGGKNSFSFVQNNYSPTALDRIVIYRQTRNQFAAMKEAINRV